ncbi:hypothetical protein [Algoriphagus sp.]|uniref:hypothetical protein n=1 Tax=Algoriphagus sp. TaxID=1872435 RepID=UPI00391D00AC
MKRTLIFLFILSAFFQSVSFGQKQRAADLELENFVLITDQDFYLTGDRVWFAAKLLKNHESFRYSKLAYIAVLDGAGNPIHQEKMLLTGQDMVYGDFFIPENSKTGVFSIVVYTMWMANFDDFPIAKKEFLVANPNAPKAQGEPALFWEQIPFENAPISIFHTSDQKEVVEIQDKDGKTIEILEAVFPLKKTLSRVKPEEGYKIVFRNSTFEIEPQKWHWEPSGFTLNSVANSGAEKLKIITHSNWMVIEDIALNQAKSQLNKAFYQNLSSFDISIVNESNQLVWSYQVQLPTKTSGQMVVNSRGKTGEAMTLDLVGFLSQYQDGIVMAKEEGETSISDFVDILNHPNWKNLTSEFNNPNLVTSLSRAVENPLMLKDYSPMFDYKIWSTDISSRFKSSVNPTGFSFSISDQLLDPFINRKIYREHFEIAEEVVALQSPFQADKVYYIQDYFEFPNLEVFMKEIVPQVRFRKSKTQDVKEIFVANTDNQNVKFNKKPLILVDFYRPISLEEFWKLDMVSVDRIELYYHRSTLEKTNLGEASGDGLIVVYTKNNEYFLKNNLGKDRYFLADVSVPRRPDYSGKSTQKISANALQFLDSGLTFYRGRSKSGNLKFDTAGSWLVEAWVFGNSGFERIQKRVVIDP